MAALPALLALLFGAWCGTLSGGATAAGAAATAAALLGSLVLAGVPLPDPLRLGRAGWFLPIALWLAAAASAWASPVPRAGRVGLLLLPAFLALPAAVERCWRDDTARRRGVRCLAAVVGAIALGALGDAIARGGLAGRPALPLGHHNLLAAWLAILLPLALLPSRETGRWRWLGWSVGIAAVAALLATRSLAGLAALGVEAVALATWTWRRGGGGSRNRRRRVAVAALLVLLALSGAALQARRLAELAGGRDPSAQARAVYYSGGWKGFLARPALGWGPGSTPWTIARFLTPRAGVNPPGEIVPDLHSLPLQIAFELGAPGLLLACALAAVFARRRLAEMPEAADPALAVAGLLGLAGGAVTAMGSAAVAVTALPLAAALAAGAALAGTRQAPAAAAGDGSPVGLGRVAPRAPRLGAALWAALSLVVLVPLVRAEHAYERAQSRGSLAEVRASLESAVSLDPAFPLYRARLAWAMEREVSAASLASGVVDPAAVAARRAAARSYRVAPLWLQAGVRGFAAGRPWAPDALRRACVLDPLGPFAPFLLAAAAPDDPAAPALAARALAADPRLAAATFWIGREALLERSVATAAGWPGLDAGWRRTLVGQVTQVRLAADDGARGWLSLTLDGDTAFGLSLNAFRRRSWPADWPIVEVRLGAARSLRLPSAALLPSTSPSVFAAAGCIP